MSRIPEGVNKLTESTYKNVMEQFNPGLRNLVNLGKTYEKSVAAMTLAGRAYFDAISKLGEVAIVSPASRELGVVLMEIAEAHQTIHNELDENFKRFHKDILSELEKKTEADTKYMTATFKRYQTEHKLKQDSLERSQTDLKKLRRKSQSKHSSKYDHKENEYLETISSRQTDMQRFIADGCREALLEEKRRFCFLADKHCLFSYQIGNFHEKAKEVLSENISRWQEKCTDINKVPETLVTMINGLSVIPEHTPKAERPTRNHVRPMSPPPAPPLKAHVNLGSIGEGSLSRSTSQSSGLSIGQKVRVRTIFPHTAGNSDTLLSFEEGEIITLLMHDEQDGLAVRRAGADSAVNASPLKSVSRGWFPSSYCRPYQEQLISNSNLSTPVRSLSECSLPEEDDDVYDSVLLPPPDYSDDIPSSPVVPMMPSPNNTVSLMNGSAKPSFFGEGNPFATVKLRPTVTNDRSAPAI
ncbi:Brain-specific angiogenesis inhibitor 1-associated protein 2-like protein 1 [Oryzias melastigma]|uniref:Brain-specific angiogenesis inhibitor 1-associated protein 2-like protein 1 n=1 Tax=Oryzias melastigma TaxID=30732 RepID=A0A834CFP1_ORYME|nr:Brain-specific angiogenesis inhibitor 1-associated protein 2-like protein 1 [Oryzias melastigma]